MTPCSMCGRPQDEHDRHVRFGVPDQVFDLPAGEHTAGVRMSGDDARSSVAMVVPEVGNFVRALLPVQLSGGYRVTFGVWLRVDAATYDRVTSVWWEPEYADLTFEASLANSVLPWGLFGVRVGAGVRETEHTPYCVSSPEPRLARVLTVPWPHDLVLNAIEGRA